MVCTKCKLHAIIVDENEVKCMLCGQVIKEIIPDHIYFKRFNFFQTLMKDRPTEKIRETREHKAQNTRLMEATLKKVKPNRYGFLYVRI